MENKKEKINNGTRFIIFVLAVLFPALLLAKGVYGFFLVTFSIPILWQVGFLDEPFKTLGFNKADAGRSLLAGFLSGIFLGLLGGGIITLTGITGIGYENLPAYSPEIFGINFSIREEFGFKLLERSQTPGGLFQYFFFCVLFAGLGEELFWRGFLQRKISKYVSTHGSVWITAFLFGTVHLYLLTILSLIKGIFFLFIIVLAGAIWGYLREKFDNIWGPAISHGLAAFLIWKYFFFTAI